LPRFDDIEASLNVWGVIDALILGMSTSLFSSISREEYYYADNLYYNDTFYRGYIDSYKTYQPGFPPSHLFVKFIFISISMITLSLMITVTMYMYLRYGVDDDNENLKFLII
jgi:hypothetical protein